MVAGDVCRRCAAERGEPVCESLYELWIHAGSWRDLESCGQAGARPGEREPADGRAVCWERVEGQGTKAAGIAAGGSECGGDGFGQADRARIAPWVDQSQAEVDRTCSTAAGRDVWSGTGHA